MNGLAALGAFAQFLILALPAFEEDIQKAVQAFKQLHPELEAPPPADAEIAIDKAIDAEIVKLPGGAP